MRRIRCTLLWMSSVASLPCSLNTEASFTKLSLAAARLLQNSMDVWTSRHVRGGYRCVVKAATTAVAAIGATMFAVAKIAAAARMRDVPVLILLVQ